MEMAATLLEMLVLLVGAATLIVQGLAVITGITPTTRDDEIVDAVSRYLKKIQKVLNAVALNDVKAPSKRGNGGPPAGGNGAVITE